MKKHTILYYTWGETTQEDCVQAFQELGMTVFVVRENRTSYDYDEKFMSAIRRHVDEKKIDCIFTFNYFPDLSRVALEKGIEYVCWCYDSPLLVLESVTLVNPCNRVFVFDYGMYERYAKQGIATVQYMPLACNVGRVQRLVTEYRKQHFGGDSARGYEHDITFLGNMYNNEYNFFDQIKYLPPYVEGYLDALMDAQTKLYGMDLCRELLNDNLCKQIYDYVQFDLGEYYRDRKREVLLGMIQKKITETERRNLLTVLGEYYALDHYAEAKTEKLPVRYCGYADYRTQMPIVFATSKINLNITLRSIQTGIPLRVIDILGAGGFCLTNYQAELAEYFVNGESIVWYESYEDLFDRVAYYLARDEERERIAQAGHRIVAEQFTYERILERIFS